MSYSIKPYKINKVDMSNSTVINTTSLNFKFPSSTTFTGCINDSSTNKLNCPNIMISNQYLSTDSLNTGNISIIYEGTFYLFDNIYLTKPGNPIINYTNSSNTTTTSDMSSSSLLLVCKSTKSSNNYLTIIRDISYNNNSNNLISTSLNSIINKSISCTGNGSSNETNSSNTIDLNLLIPMDNFFTLQSPNSTITNTVIIFPDTPINLSITLKTNILNKLSTTSNLSYISYPRSYKFYKSSIMPINSLSDQEDEIYIDCRPTNQEGDLLISNSINGTYVQPEKDIFNINNILGEDKSIYTTTIMGILIMILIIKGGEFLLKSGSRTFLGNL